MEQLLIGVQQMLAWHDIVYGNLRYFSIRS
jgi:hypothetical protein